jgi:anti-sigma factor RsiW
MSKRDEMSEHWEARINALLDGELDDDEIAALKQEAEQDQALAQAIIDAYALQGAMEHLVPERAPDTLRKKLARIPKTEGKEHRRWLGMPRWAPIGALAAIPLAVIAMVMMTSESPQQPREYTEAEILEARQELITAFAYLDRVSERAAMQVQDELAKELRSAVNDNVSKHMPFTHPSEQEEKS